MGLHRPIRRVKRVLGVAGGARQLIEVEAQLWGR